MNPTSPIETPNIEWLLKEAHPFAKWPETSKAAQKELGGLKQRIAFFERFKDKICEALQCQDSEDPIHQIKKIARGGEVILMENKTLKQRIAELETQLKIAKSDASEARW